MAHDIPTSGHQGQERTYQRLKSHFFWPKMQEETAEFVGSCETCQIVKGRTFINKAPLEPIPVVDTPLKKIGMDIFK